MFTLYMCVSAYTDIHIYIGCGGHRGSALHLTVYFVAIYYVARCSFNYSFPLIQSLNTRGHWKRKTKWFPWDGSLPPPKSETLIAPDSHFVCISSSLKHRVEIHQTIALNYNSETLLSYLHEFCLMFFKVTKYLAVLSFQKDKRYPLCT